MPNSGLLLANLGSPASPTEADVRAYLDEFLMDPRILDMPAPLRWLIVKRFILPKRPAHSARAYQSIWWEEGSPLIVLSGRVRAKLEARLHMPVVMAMRYGQPSVRAGLEELMARLGPASEIVLFPMYPHYAMSTYETLALKTLVELEKLVGVRVTGDRAATRWLRGAVVQAGANSEAIVRRVGDYTLRIIPPHYDHPDYIAALAASIRLILDVDDFDHLLFSFHGIPERHLHKTAPRGSGCLRESCCMAENERGREEVISNQLSVSSEQSDRVILRKRSERRISSALETRDSSLPLVAQNDTRAVCYRHQAFTTMHLVARALGLPPERYSLAFQSRLGRDKWLGPPTVDELARLPGAGVKRLAVVTPSFTVDCLETLEEIGMAGREIFMQAGGEHFQLIPCLNDNEDWVEAMAGMVNAASAQGGPAASARS